MATPICLVSYKFTLCLIKRGQAVSLQVIGLGKWSAQDDWVGQREHFGSERRAKTDEKFVESQSEELSRS